jgi:2',3'-cyclic-nucleotide 2'-phosphodiesterase (5'-nucleotidase family)
MGEQPFPDGKDARWIRPPRRHHQGRARQAAAEGRTVIVAHGGDTLSPSVMSGLDHGAHIIALTNMIAPDIFVAGNHEFDFGKAIFLERMAEAKFSALWRQPARCQGGTLPAHLDRSIVTSAACASG